MLYTPAEEILRINDELNNVFLRFDRHERLRGGPASQTAAPVSQPELAPGIHPVAAMPAANLPPPYPVRSSLHYSPFADIRASGTGFVHVIILSFVPLNI